MVCPLQGGTGPPAPSRATCLSSAGPRGVTIHEGASAPGLLGVRLRIRDTSPPGRTRSHESGYPITLGVPPVALSRKRLPPGETPVRICSSEISSEALIAQDTILLGHTLVPSFLRALSRSEREDTPGRNSRQSSRRSTRSESSCYVQVLRHAGVSCRA